MRNISRELCERLRMIRREKGITQMELALAVGCKQAAISMFESGNVTKLSDEYVKAIAEKLGVDLDAESKRIADESREADETEKAAPAYGEAASGYCPDPECPSNSGYEVRGRRFFRVSIQSGRYCAHCGEVLVKRCPNCGAPLNEGACCTSCGKPYISI